MNISKFVNKDLVFLNQEFDTNSELFEFVGAEANDLGVAKESYADALKEREANFPTGLELENFGVAIPHSDSIHINEEFISVVTLDKPVQFSSMEDLSKKLDVRLVFVLGLKKAEDQLSILQAIISVIQDESKVEKLISAASSDEVLEILENN
ncbi:PTS sugar transporter subunit IIA [Eremococcus coleocola]|uniref:Phosphoenolpyruvate-dependent sugar phosphotransferase system, EIIA 2 n=1 Tax=Eremococcus coleocola ACS-139-V-Col8 TaxID=908337 RepID=E4KN72_9LACT|nr:PTS sugar transporter subunit IIA [Eremococcus coleocola]EFR31769.1 phosphoenolpyruvate-dependent sugar phosphotransferase system, EIIA 2 [Eremococcus coleocola ACS-139-V-Col8]